MNQVKIAELKARLSHYLRIVRRGHSLTVLDRETPIANIMPYDSSRLSLKVRRPDAALKLRHVPVPPPLRIDVDIVKLLLEERQGER